MNRSQFKKCTDTFTEDRQSLMFKIKNMDYADENDALANFRERATLIGVTPLMVAVVDASKHFQVIARAARGVQVTRAQALEERFTDLGNYVDLAYGLSREDVDSAINSAAGVHDVERQTRRVR